MKTRDEWTFPDPLPGRLATSMAWLWVFLSGARRWWRCHIRDRHEGEHYCPHCGRVNR